MKSSSKIAITAFLIIVAIPPIVVLAAEIILNSEAVRSEIEGIVAEALKMEFKIEGRIEIHFFPLLNLAANNVTVRIKSGQIASADQIVIDPRLAPLLNLDVEIEKAHLQRPRLAFNSRAIEKIMALVNAESSNEPLPVESLMIESFSISEARLAYTGDQARVDVDAMSFRGGRIGIIANRTVIIDDVFGFLKAVDFTGDMAIRPLKRFLKSGCELFYDGSVTHPPSTQK